MVAQVAAELYKSQIPIALLVRTEDEHWSEQKVRLADTDWERAYQQREQERKRDLCAKKGLLPFCDETRRKEARRIRAARTFKDRTAGPPGLPKLRRTTLEGKRAATRRRLIKGLEQKHGVAWLKRQTCAQPGAAIVPPVQAFVQPPVGMPAEPDERPLEVQEKTKVAQTSTERVQAFRKRKADVALAKVKPPPTTAAERARSWRLKRAAEALAASSPAARACMKRPAEHQRPARACMKRPAVHRAGLRQ